MTDLVTRLRRWAHAAAAVPASDLMDEAADEIERLRGYRDSAESDAGIAHMLVDRYRMTDEEREAISTAAAVSEGIGFDDLPAALRGLLERTKEKNDE